MHKTSKKNLRKIMLAITFFSLFIGTCSTIIPASQTRTSPLLEEPNNEKLSTQDNIVNKDDNNRQESYNLQYTIRFSETDLNFGTFQGYDFITMKECSYLTEYGKPLLPVKHLLIALPT